MEVGIASAILFTGLGLNASRQQARLESAKIGFETESARLAASEAAYESTRNFRQAIGTQVALAGARGGPGSSNLLQFSTESYTNYLADQAVIERTRQAAGIAGGLERGQSNSNRRLRDIGLLAGLGRSIGGSINLNAAPAPGASLGGKIAGGY